MDVTGYKARCIDGKWHAVVYWKDNYGKRHQKSRRIHADSEKQGREKKSGCALGRYSKQALFRAPVLGCRPVKKGGTLRRRANPF